MSQEDNVRISLFILKVDSSSFKAAETYLINRGWQIGVSIQLRDALSYIIQNQPQYVMIPSDHSNKKVKSFPKLLIQAFPVRIIGYCNSGSPQAIGVLREMSLDYNLFPPISGPAIERMVLKIIKEEEHLRTLNEPQGLSNRYTSVSHSENKSGNDSVLSLFPSDHKASSSEKPYGLYSSPSMQNSYEQARAALQQMIASGGLDEDPTPNSVLETQQTSSFKQSESTLPNSSIPSIPIIPTGSSYIPPLEIHPKQMDEDSDLSWAQAFNKDHSQLLSDHKAPLTESERKKLEEIESSLIIRGTQQALDESVVISEEMEGIKEIEKSSNLACILLQSSRFSGYLVAALGKNRKIDTEFLKAVKDRLLSFLKVHGEIIKEEETIDVNIQEIEFNEWALEQAHFLRRSVHEGDEIAMAFFPTKETSLKIEESVSEKMVKMDMNELIDDHPVEFDLYIYLPENNKYLLYTPQGRPIYSQQKNRLKEKGIDKLHLRKESISNVKKYKAQNFLNQKIEEYRMKKLGIDTRS